MKETWRWFGPDDPVVLDHAKQAGASGIVTALHDIPPGEAWPYNDICERKSVIEEAGLEWSVVESIPVPDTIKTRSGEYRKHIDNWKSSLGALAQAGIRTVCYNFMPVVDWTRTDLAWRLPTTGYALRFDWTEFAAYDVFILARPGAEADYPPERIASAEDLFGKMSDGDRTRLEEAVIAGLPGSDATYDRNSFRRLLELYEDIDADALRANLKDFLNEVVPVAADEGVQLCVHPDDPPAPIFGLPRIVSTAADVAYILDAVDHQANGITLCAGSYGAREDNDVVEMAKQFAPRIHFGHLRNVTREADGSFFEAEHLYGDVEIISVVGALMEEEVRRGRQGRTDSEIPMRPDHGHLLADDIGKQTNPGYSLVGRLKGLAELRGVMRTIAAGQAPVGNVPA